MLSTATLRLTRSGDAVKSSPINFANTRQTPQQQYDHPAAIGDKKMAKSLGKLKNEIESFSASHFIKYLHIFLLMAGSVTGYILLSKVTLLLLTPVDPNLAFIWSALVSGIVIAVLSFSHRNSLPHFPISTNDIILGWLANDFPMWESVAALLGLIGGSFFGPLLLWLVFADLDLIKPAAAVINPLNTPEEFSDFAIWAVLTAGYLFISMANWRIRRNALHPQYSALYLGLVAIAAQIMSFRITAGYFDFFITLGIDAITKEWNTFEQRTWFLYGVASLTSIILVWLFISIDEIMSRWHADTIKIPKKSSDNDSTPLMIDEE